MNESEMVQFLDGAVKSVKATPKIPVTRHEFAALAKCVLCILEKLREQGADREGPDDEDDDARERRW